MMEETPTLEGWDIVSVVVYFVLVLLIGFIAMWRTKRGTISGYFLAGRFMTWFPVSYAR